MTEFVVAITGPPAAPGASVLLKEPVLTIVCSHVAGDARVLLRRLPRNPRRTRVRKSVDEAPATNWDRAPHLVASACS